MGDLGSGHLRCGRDGCKENVKTAAQELSHGEPLFHEQGYDGKIKTKKKTTSAIPERDMLYTQRTSTCSKERGMKK